MRENKRVVIVTGASQGIGAGLVPTVGIRELAAPTVPDAAEIYRTQPPQQESS